LKPFYFSTEENKEVGRTWCQLGEECKISYDVSPFPYLIGDERPRRTYYRASFEHSPSFDNDRISFAYCIPYTYSRLLAYLGTFGPKVLSGILQEGKLCDTLSGLRVPLLTITAPAEGEIPVHERKIIIVTGIVCLGMKHKNY
jgi:hypothetical protein